MPNKVKAVKAKVISVKGTCGLGHKPEDVVTFTETGVEGRSQRDECIFQACQRIPAHLVSDAFP